MTIAWHVYPLGFVGAPIRPDTTPPLCHRLPRLTSWLAYAAAMGCNALSLGPVFASSSHGYDTLDYRRIDPRLGDQADFDELVGTAHALGMRVYLDGVFNHVGRGFPALQRALAAPDGDPCRRFFAWDNHGQPRRFEGHAGLIELNHADPDVQARVADIMCLWLGRGVDGWRLDAAYTTGPAFWAKVLPRVRERFGQAYVFAEILHGDFAGFVRASGVDSATQYELWKAIWSSIHDANFFELKWALARHQAMLGSFVPVTFIGNHDVDRIASQIGPDAVPLALAILMTVGGDPHLYYGDEQGFTGTKGSGPGTDDPLRPAFPAAPDQLPDGGLYGIHRELIGLRHARPWLRRAVTTLDEVTCPRLAYTSADPDDPGRCVRVVLDLNGGPRVSISDAAGAALFDYRG
ncbi:MAG: alpha-amylase family glycosyl hydrolase [Propionibacteriaceae bacterium]|nr:alpha-amylase family glycosyl hydrolase [Propionibacteriaceae bacterium]